MSPVKSKSKQKRAEKEPNPIDLAIQQFGPGLSFDRNLPDESVPGPGANTAYSALQSRGGTASLETYQQAVEASTSCTSPTVLKDDNGRPPLPGVLAYLLARPRAFVPTVDVHHTSGPGVDAHIGRESLKYGNMQTEIRAYSNRFLKRQRVKVRVSAALTCLVHFLTCSSVPMPTENGGGQEGHG